ncbi:MAG: hypothetical protein HY825_10045 [Acidobacteria bacterium]|nr:hypothetical protein [Acidobacteriota bacterium]
MIRRIARVGFLVVAGFAWWTGLPAPRAAAAAVDVPVTVELPAGAPATLRAAAIGVPVALDDWPVAPGMWADVVVTRREVYAKDAEIVVSVGRMVRPGERSSWRFFWGAATDDPAVRVMIALDDAGTVARAVSFTVEGAAEIRPSAIGGVFEIVDADAAAAAAGATPWTCAQDSLPAEVPVAAPWPDEAGSDHLATLHTLTVAVDTDTELLSVKFGDNTTNATNYIASLFAAMNAMYEADVNVRLLVGTTYLRVGTDPWTVTGSPANGDHLDEFGNYWIANYSGVTRGLAAMLSGKQASGASGIAWVFAPCSSQYGYSFSEVYRIDNLAGDARIVGHEIGHNFGSPHTHCYDPPIDHCWSGEVFGLHACYSGATSCPGGPGTIMSYCHKIGCGNNLMQFGATVVAYLDPIIAARVGTCVFPQGGGSDTVGIFRTSDRQWYLRNSNSAGNADIVIPYGDPAIDVPVAGDWNGDGVDTVGIYRAGTFYLRNTNTGGTADIVVAFGAASDLPVAGDWNGDGIDTIGVYRPSIGTWFLRNSNSAGSPDLSFAYGLVAETPVVGDWNNDGTDTVGIFRGSDRQWYLRNSNSGGSAEIVFPYGDPATDVPVVGDWNGDGADTVGVYRPASGSWFLRNSNSGGLAELSFSYGILNEKPVVGDWNGQ